MKLYVAFNDKSGKPVAHCLSKKDLREYMERRKRQYYLKKSSYDYSIMKVNIKQSHYDRIIDDDDIDHVYDSTSWGVPISEKELNYVKEDLYLYIESFRREFIKALQFFDICRMGTCVKIMSELLLSKIEALEEEEFDIYGDEHIHVNSFMDYIISTDMLLPF